MNDNDILQMLEQGYTYQQIADIEGVSRQRIHQRIKNIKPQKVYYDQDITFCSSKSCKNKRCKRNRCHIDWTIKPYQSFADFENTQYCPMKRSDNSSK